MGRTSGVSQINNPKPEKLVPAAFCTCHITLRNSSIIS